MIEIRIDKKYWKKVPLIYIIRNTINPIIYIGSTSNFNQRKNVYNHRVRQERNKEQRKLINAIKKYGAENFYFELVELTSLENLIKTEQFYLDTLLFASEPDKRFNKLGYNICRVAGSTLGVKQSKEFCEAVSKRMKGYKHSPESIKKSADARRGQIVPQERRDKIRATLTGYKHTEETKRKVSEARKRQVRKKGYKMSPEFGENQRKRMTGRVVSEETRQKLSLANKGKKPSPQAMEAMIKANTGRKRSPEEIERRKNAPKRKCSPETIAKMKARVQSEESKLKRSLAQKGIPKGKSLLRSLTDDQFVILEVILKT
jgi:group I intron endonuclease